MPKAAFIQKKFGPEKEAAIKAANAIIAQYQGMGLKLTLRQLYYQFVSRNLLPNTERSYKWLGDVISDGRWAGRVDWDAIEDRVRVPQKASEFDGLDGLAKAALASYRLDRWEGQTHYVELWVEKRALAGVLRPIADSWHATLMVNQGYSSSSAMYDAAVRIAQRIKKGQRPIIVYLGDHDPSGEDMVRDIDDRFRRFGVGVRVEKLALTMAQVEEYEPPPNPAKMSDSRAAKYVAEHGHESWEVDALPPDVLTTLIHQSFRTYVDFDAMREVIEKEKTDKKKLAEALRKATKGQAAVPSEYLEVDEPPWEPGEGEGESEEQED